LIAFAGLRRSKLPSNLSRAKPAKLAKGSRHGGSSNRKERGAKKELGEVPNTSSTSFEVLGAANLKIVRTLRKFHAASN